MTPQPKVFPKKGSFFSKLKIQLTIFFIQKIVGQRLQQRNRRLLWKLDENGDREKRENSFSNLRDAKRAEEEDVAAEAKAT